MNLHCICHKTKAIALIAFQINKIAIALIVFACLSTCFFLFISYEDKKQEKNLNLFADDEWEWAPQGDKIKTKWAKEVDPKNVWPEYPRPQLQRKDWLNLNGAWSYSIREPDYLKPEKHDGKILESKIGRASCRERV